MVRGLLAGLLGLCIVMILHPDPAQAQVLPLGGYSIGNYAACVRSYGVNP